MAKRIKLDLTSNKARLEAFRSILKDALKIDAFIVPSADSHQSEYVAGYFERRSFISGFTGSAGTAIITQSQATLWTDGRYYLQAEQELNDDWKLIKQGLFTQAGWLSENLPPNSKVGVDPFLIPYKNFKKIEEELDLAGGHEIVCVSENPVDQVWEEAGDRPAFPQEKVFVLPLQYSGKTIEDKLIQVREKMNEKKKDVLVLTELDEIAWIFNLRGNDIVYNPVFISYAIITKSEATLFIDENKLSDDVRTHLGQVIIKPYNDIVTAINKVAENKMSIWTSEQASYGLLKNVEKKLLYQTTTPVNSIKAVKNEVEIEGMKACHIRDGLALIKYFCWLEKSILAGEQLTEVDGADKLEEFRKQGKDFVSLSFDTISSTGPNGAIIHYHPQKGKCAVISPDEIYLCDSGAQYKDGTTDVTRTICFKPPSEHQKMCFTLVLKGQINLDRAVFPNGTPGRNIDVLARSHLWQYGLDYLHGTGHGVGSFLNVHEGPIGITFRPGQGTVALEENNILSNEPGYYENGKFGIRLENLFRVIKTNPKFNFNEKGYLTFETLTMAPIDLKLINVEMLTKEEIKHVNDYHKKVWENISPLLIKENDKETLAWLENAVTPL